MTHEACESKLCSFVRSSMHPYSLGNWVTVGCAVMYYARAAHAFSVGSYHVAIAVPKHCLPTQCILKCIRFSILVRCPRSLSLPGVMATICKQLLNKAFFINQMYLLQKLNIKNMAH